MKYLAIFAIRLYQIIVSPLLLVVTGQKNACRYQIPCSEYAILQIKKHGIIRGSYYAARRLLSCRPW